MLFNSLEKLKSIFEVTNYKEDKKVRSFQFDSRLIEAGDVFVALKAERDGHDFMQAAIEKGAIAIIVEDEKPELAIPQFKTKNTWQALELIAEQSRKAFKGKTIAVTGSCGKTTIKQMLLHSLNNCYATEGNFNGLLGLPITLTHLTQDSDYAVLELGTDEMGNLDKLTSLAKPDFAIVTSIGPAHLQMFKTINNIITEKLSVANGLSENGSLIIPHEYLDRAKELTTKDILTVSLTDNQASAYVISTEGNNVKASINNQELTFSLEDTSSHKLINALIVLTLLDIMGFDIQIEKAKIENFKAPAGRGEQTFLANNVTLFDESYNANPLSMKKAIESFKNLSKNKKVAILGDMLELGEDEVLLHMQLANFCKEIETIYTVGKLMSNLHTQLENMQINTKHFESHEDMLEFLASQTFENCDILVKGSKGSKVSTAIELLKKTN
ncbi:MAG TPA: hypothetical protein DCL21_04215 [Alphaproteobacteria bacterium]|nr:hypothetical protein [Alphaproteobacteria bacterium]